MNVSKNFHCSHLIMPVIFCFPTGVILQVSMLYVFIILLLTVYCVLHLDWLYTKVKITVRSMFSFTGLSFR